jgi:hypothetical protein
MSRRPPSLLPSLFISLILALAACDSGSVPGFAGMACSTSGDCNGGLSCLEYDVPGGDGGCRSLGMQCAQPCKSTADCASMGSGMACYAACGTVTLCQPATDAGH